MAYSFTYLGLVNRVLQDFNEVPLTSTTFASATGFHGAVKDYVNDALNDIYTWQDTEWPFLWTEKSFTTVIGTTDYTPDASLVAINWDSFAISPPSLSATLTQTSGTVTATVASGHQLVDGDSVIIKGATETDYNGTFTATVVSSTVFTYTISNTSATSPATGSPTTTPPYSSTFLPIKDYDQYVRDNRDNTVNAQIAEEYSRPVNIVRKPNNSVIVTPAPDRIYTIKYEGFTTPTELSLYTDVPLVPSIFKQVIIDRCGTYCLAFRDNDAQLPRTDKKFEDNCHRMRRILIPQGEFITFKD